MTSNRRTSLPDMAETIAGSLDDASGDEVKRLSRRLIQVQEQERRAFGRELHDQIGQMVAILGLAVGQAKNSPPDKIGEALNETQRLVKDLMARVHEMSLDLRPDMLEDLGLLPTLLSYAERFRQQTGVKVDFKHNGLDRSFPLEIATAAYRIVQEALTNVARHAGVPEASLRVWSDQTDIFVQIEDRGNGFNPEEYTGNEFLGLRGMRERAEWLGGHFTIDSVSAKGTQIMAVLPLL